MTDLPCGQRRPDCSRPASCDECLPRDRRHLHDRILARCDPAWYGMADNPIRMFAAMRAVVAACCEHQSEGADGRPTAVELIDPSMLLAAIARELGIREAL